ncbi:MAG: hypothetical protein AAGJ73_11920 [Pseudomonadota bacterium]
MTGFLQVIIDFLGLAIALAAGVLDFARETYIRAALKPTLGAALFIAFLSGISEMIGQSVILVINRVPLYRFLASLVFTGVVYLVASITWALSVVMIAPLFGAGIVSAIGYAGLFTVIAMSFAPRLLGVLAIAPYFGVAFSYLLDAWVLACVIFGLHAASDLPFEAAAICGALGWTTSFVIRALTGRILRGPLTALRRVVSGSLLERTPQQLLAEFSEGIRERRVKS